ncbi:hypothetical protein BLX24_01495 [Arsenicibacter rosenii]|uniref:Uncharacterized protein n=2 Tax=Arsenicibacter rosenii TaxID=1750698 RepID=A0A1S2VS89_9BACT|nr:hypothetical protein BLX24_01495 [Arsenicibacter rosenii]
MAGLNKEALIQGIVTVSRQFDNGQILYVQDKTGGMALFVPATNAALFAQVQTSIRIGNEIKTLGVTGYQKGVFGLTGISSLSVINAAASEPEPKLITISQMGDPEILGQLVRLDSCLVTDTRPAFVPETDFTIRDTTNNTGKFRIRTGVNDVINSLKPTRKFTLTGILDGYDLDDETENGSAGNRLYPRFQKDIQGTTELARSDGGITNRDQTLELATWNTDSLGAVLQGPVFSGADDVRQQANAGSLIRYLNADILVLTGVSDPVMLTAIGAQVSDALSQTYAAVCAQSSYYTAENPRVCFLYKTALFTTPPAVSVVSASMVTTDWDGGRFPVVLTGNAKLNGLSRRINVVGIHAHEGATVTDFSVRQRAATQLKAYLDSRSTEAIFVAGEFGDDMLTSIASPNPSPYAGLLSGTGSFSAATRGLSANRLTTSLSADRMTSHILMSDELYGNYIPGTAATLSPDAIVPEYLANVADWGMSTSGYLPVMARFSLATPGSLTATLVGTSTICGENTAPLQVNIAGGVAPYQLVIHNGTSTTTITNYTSGAKIPLSLTSTTSYTLVSVSDALSITAGTLSGTATVTVIPNVRPVSVTISPASTSYCQGKTVSLSAVVNSGQLPLRYQWNSGDITPVIAASATGTYQLTVIDGLGCTGIASMSTTVNTIPDLSTFGASVSALCTATGQVTTFTANIGNLATTASYTLGSVTGSVSGTIAGSGQYEQFMAITRSAAYTLTVGTPQGCTATATQSISLNASPSIFNFAATPSCSGRPSTFTALVSGLTGGYSYTLTDGVSNVFGTGSAATPFNAVLVPAATSTYSLIVANQNCTAQSSTLAQVGTTAPVATLSTSTSVLTCSLPSAILFASGGVSYAFSPINGSTLTNTSGTITVNQPGTYTVRVTDVYGCTASASTFVIANNTVPAATLTATNSVFNCTNRTSTLIATGGDLYSFYNPAGILLQTSTLNTFALNTAFGYTGGTYRVVVTTASGCTAAATTTITSNNAVPTVGLTVSGQITCAQPKVQLAVTHTETATSYKFTNFNVPGYVAFATPPNNTIDVTTAGLYQVEVTFTNGCVGVATVQVGASSSVPGVTLSASGQVSCSNPTVTLSALHTDAATRYEFTSPSGVTTLVTPPTNSITANTAGTYSVRVVFQSGCTNTATVNVSQSSESPRVVLQSNGQISCSQAKVTLSAVHTGSALSYEFYGPNNFYSKTTNNSIDVSTAGQYFVDVRFSSGCIASSPLITVAAQSGAITAFITGNTTVCSGGSTILTATTSDGASFRWSTGETAKSINYRPGGTTPVSVTVTLGSCVAVATTTVFVTTCAPLVLAAPSYNCSTGQFVFNSTGGDGTPVEYFAVGITGWTTTSGPYTVKPASDAGSFTLYARTQGNPNTVVTYTWDWKAVCNVTTPPSSTTTTPPSSTTTTPTATGCGSAASTLGSPLALLTPTYNCQTGAVQFRIAGGNGKTIEYFAIGITGWTTNCQSAIDDPAIVALIRSQSSQISPYTLRARQDGNTVTLSWDPRTACTAGGRESGKSTDYININVLGNPTLGEEVEVDIESRGGSVMSLYLTDAQGNVRFEEQIGKPEPVEHKTIRLGRQAGLYLLQVKAGTAVKTVKILRQ